MKRAFTLVEILVSMAIISALVGLGIVSLSQFRRTMEADQAGDAIMAGIKETKNLAKNNSVNADVTPSEMLNTKYAYKLSFNNFTITRQLCHKGFSDVWNPLICYDEKVDLKPSSFSNVLLVPKSRCNTVLIENLTEDMLQYENTNLLPDGFCEIDIKFKDTNEVYKTLKINTNNGVYFIQK